MNVLQEIWKNESCQVYGEFMCHIMTVLSQLLKFNRSLNLNERVGLLRLGYDAV